MKNLILLFIGVIIFISAVGILTKRNQQGPLLKQFQATPTVNLKQIQVKGITVNISVSDTPEKRAKGLSGLSSLPENQGMLFVFDKKGLTPNFWMKDMLIPLDIIWISENKVVKIDKDIPPLSSTPDSSLTIYSPNSPIDYVLEVNSGFSEKNSVRVGDSVTLSSI